MQHSFYLQKKSIRVSVTESGRQIRKSTGLSISDPSLWDSKAKSLRAKCKDLRVQKSLLSLHAFLTDAESSVKTFSEAEKALSLCLGVPHQEPTDERFIPTFWEYFKEWSERPSSSLRQRKLAYRVVARLMGRRENWKDIDSAYWFRLNLRMEAEGFSVNYRWNIGSRLKCVLHEGYKMHYHRNDDFREFKTHKEQTESIALTPEEIELLWEWTPTSEMKGKVRDLALIGYYSASRFSDYSRLSLSNIRDGRLTFMQKKTQDKVVIPAAARLVELLERNGGKSPCVNQVVFNRYIKIVAKSAGIGGEVWLPKSRQKKDGSATYRWEMVSSHTFRRSAVSNVYLQGASLKDCMTLSGHKSLKSMQSYLRLSKEDSIKRLSEMSLFK